MTGNKIKRILAGAVLTTVVSANFSTVAAQDVVTADDFASAFVFRKSQRPAPGRTAFKSVSKVTRTQKARIESLNRVTRQALSVAKTAPKRQITKEIDPKTVDLASAAFKRKTPQETAVIFAGVGEYYLRQDQIEESINWFRESVLLDEKNVRAKFGLSDALTRKGDVLLAKENYDVARLLFNEALTNNPANAATLAGLAEIASAKNDDATAISNYEKALALDTDLSELNAPLGVLYFQRGEIAKAETYLQRALAADPENAETQLFVGLLRYKQGRFAEAETALRKSIMLDPNNAEAHYFLGDTLTQLKKEKDALSSYEKAVAINPRYADAWFDLGAAYFDAGRSEDAIKAFKTVTKLDPRNGEAYIHLADIYRSINDWDNAIGSYRMGLNFIKPDADVLSNYGYAAIRRAVTPGYANFWAVGIDNFSKSVAIAPDFVGYSNLGWAYYNFAQVKRSDEAVYKDNLVKAREALRKANELKPSAKVAAAVNLNLGMTLNELGESKDAIPVLKAAADARKDWIPALNELGLAYRKTNDFENAITSFKKVLDLDPKFPAGLYNLAEAYYRNGKRDEAKKIYERLKATKHPTYGDLLVSVTNGGILR